MRSCVIILILLNLLVTFVESVQNSNDGSALKEFLEDDELIQTLANPEVPDTTNLLQSPIKTSFSTLIDSIVSKILNTTLGDLLTEAIFDTPNFVLKVNTLMGQDVLILNGTRLSISFKNLTEVIKIRVMGFIQKHLKLRGIFLMLAEGFIRKNIDDYSQRIEPSVTQANFKVSSAPKLQEVNNTVIQSSVRSIVLDVVLIFIKPFQPVLNQTLVNITNELLNLYQPVLPTNYLQSVLACVINQTVLKAIEVVEAIRDLVNGLLTSHDRLSKRDVSEGTNSTESRSFISWILTPIRSLLVLILTPVHQILKYLMNYVFITVRPVVGKIVLKPIEAIIMAIINLIPCSVC